MDASVARRLSVARPSGSSKSPADALTTQERAVLRLLQEGLSTAEIVARMGIGTSTVRSHVQSILTKLGVHSRVQAVALLGDDGRLHRRRAKG